MKKATRFLKRVCACVLSVALGFGMAPTDMMAQASETTKAEKEVVLRFAVASDMHLFNNIDGAKNERMFKEMFTSAYEYAESQTYNKLDAVVLVGDIVDRGTTEEYGKLKTLFDSIDVKEGTQVLTVMGNHEWWNSKTEGSNRYLEGVKAIDKITTKTEDWSVEINGYQFIAMSPLSNDTYGTDKISWMSEKVKAAAEADAAVQTDMEAISKKPIFTFQHHPIVGTVYSSDTVTTMVEESKQLDAMYGNYNQVINFSGHLHVPVNTPTSIHQSTYTQVSTGSMYSIDSLEKDSAYGSLPPNATQTGQYTIVEVYADNTVELLPYDQFRDEFYKTPQVGSETQLTYTVNVNDTNSWLYTDAKKDSEAPAFSKGAELGFDESWTTFKSAQITIPQATDNVGVYAYDIACTSEDNSSTSNWRVFSEWYFGSDMPANIKYNMTGLKANTTYKVSVTPVDFYDNKGTPIEGTVTTKGETEGDELKFTFNEIDSAKTWWFNVSNKDLFADQYYKTPVVIDGKEGHVIMSVQSNGSVCIWSNFFDLCKDATTPVETFKIPAGAEMQAVNSSAWNTPIKHGDKITVAETLYLKKMGDTWKVGKEIEGVNGTFDSADGSMNVDNWYVGNTPVAKVEKVQATDKAKAEINNGDLESAEFNNWNWLTLYGAKQTCVTDPKDAKNHVVTIERKEDATQHPTLYYGSNGKIIFEEGKTYTATVRIMADTGLNWNMYIDGIGSSMTTSAASNWSVANGTGNGEWGTYTFTFTPGGYTNSGTSNKADGYYPEIGFQLTGGTGKIYVDDLVVTYETPKTEKTPHEVITNGNFEDATFNDWNWNMKKDNGAPEMSVTTDPDDATNHVLKLVRDSSATKTLSTSYTSGSVLYEAGKTYTVTVKVKSEGNVTYRLYYDNVGCTSNWQIGGKDYSGTTEWTTYTYQFTPETGKTWSQIGFQLISGEGNVYLDDLSVVWNEEVPVYEYPTDGLVEVDDNWALRMGSGEKDVIYDIADMPAGKYDYSFEVKNESATETAKFEFCGETIEVAPGTEWVKETGLLTASEKLEQLTFKRISGAFYLDNVELYEHMHNYDQEEATEEYLKTPATCTGAAVYYKSCECGEKGTTTFTSGTAKGHTYNKEVVNEKYLKTPATCTKAAVYYKSCECGAKGTTTFTYGTAKGHTYKTVVKKAATTSKDGQTVEKCSSCGTEKNKKTICKASNVKLDKTALSYNSKAQKPKLTVKDSKGKTISSKYYTVTWTKGLKNVGTYKVTVKFEGNYSGSKTLSFKINPKKLSIKTTEAKKAFTVKWSKQNKSVVDGYQVQYSTDKKFKKSVTKKTVKNTGKTASYKASKLKGKTKYYVRVRSYKKVGKTTYYSDWSSVKNVTTKK